ncbi:MAG: hypothetical protein ACRDJP_06335, partial [Actinomycetota bacterium]
GPAPADTSATDLTQRAAGLALEIDLVEPVTVGLVRPRSRTSELVELDRLLVVPTRPGEAVAEAGRRRIRSSGVLGGFT